MSDVNIVNLCCRRLMRAHLPGKPVPGVKYVDMLLVCPECDEDVRIRFGDPYLIAQQNRTWIDEVLSGEKELRPNIDLLK